MPIAFQPHATHDNAPDALPPPFDSAYIRGMDTEGLLEDAIHAARLGQGVHRYYQAKGFATSSKTVISDLVTEADREAEATIRNFLLGKHPDHAFLGEEDGAKGKSAFRWIVDPLDGTVNFAHGFPFYAVSVALEYQGEIVLGVVLDSVHDELFTAIRGRGAFLNGVRLRVSKTHEFKRSLLATGFPYDVDRVPLAVEYFRRVLAHGVPVRRPGAAALDLAYVAAGRIDGFWEMKLNPWDVAAGILLVEEAGGRVSNIQGQPYRLGTPELVATNGHIHSTLLQVLADAQAG